MKKDSSSKSAAQYLERIVSELGEGQKLPSIADIRKALGTGQSVIERHLSRMVAEGLIVAKSRSGYYKAIQQGRRTEVLAFDPVHPPHSPCFFNAFFKHLLYTMVCDGRLVRVNDMQVAPPDCWYDGIANHPAVTLLSYRLGLEDMGIIKRASLRGIPLLHVMPNIYEAIDPSITIDDLGLVRMQIRHLLSYGHRRIAFLMGVNQALPLSKAHRDRYNAFCSLAIEMGLQTEPRYVAKVERNRDTFRKVVASWKTCAKPPTAVIINDGDASDVYNCLQTEGFAPGKDIAVLGTNDNDWSGFLSPPLASARICLDDMGEKTIAALESLERGVSPGIQAIRVEIIQRDSVFRL